MLVAVFHESYQLDAAQQAASDLLAVLEEHTSPNHLSPSECEVLYGRSGALQAILFMRNVLEDEMWGSSLAVRLGQEIAQEGMRNLVESIEAAVNGGKPKSTWETLASIESMSRTALEKEKKDEKAVKKAVADARRPFDRGIRAFEKAQQALQGYQALAKQDYKQAHELLKKAGGVDVVQLAQVQLLMGEADQAIEAIGAFVRKHVP